MVPEKKRKKTFSSNSPGNAHHNASTSNYDNRSQSLSPSSPMELKMNVSGNFSDFMSSDDEPDLPKDNLIKSQKVKKASTTTAAGNINRKNFVSSNSNI